MKYCNTCECEKDESEFGVRRASKDGLAHKCKSCQKIYDKARAGDEHRKLQREIYTQTDEGKLTGNKAKAEYRKRNPKKAKAHAIISRAVRAGKLFRESCKCGREDTHAHHDDYKYALNIRWLCPKCHKKWHRDNGEGLNSA